MSEKHHHHHHIHIRAEWGSSLEFILTVIGYAVGLGNVWRFPFLVFKHGGAPFLIPFFIMLFLVGIPTFFLETSIGQFSGLSPTHVFEHMVPLFKGLGFAAIIINCVIGFYYNVVIAYCFYYFAFSMRSELPWSKCGDEPDCFIRKNLTGNCTAEKEEFYSRNITRLRSPSEVYFYDEVLKISDGIQNFGSIQFSVALCLFISWITVFAALSKGVQTLGKVSYFTATFPYLMLTILVIKGALLDGSELGIQFYIGSFDSSRLLDTEIWKDATVQIFYALSTCTGGLISMSSFNAFKNNLIRDALLVPILDSFTGFYSGFAIFTVLGHMYLTKCVSSFAEVAAQGPELAFVVYPEGLSLMGKAAPVFSVMFFIMMLALGFGSEFSIMESGISTFIDVFHKKINTKKKILITRAVICLVYFIFGLSMASQAGLYILNLVDYYISGYPTLIVGVLQMIVVPWIYGTERLISDIESMVGEKPKWFWNIWIVAWKFICPSVLVCIILSSFYTPKSELSLRGVPYPLYSRVIGWCIISVPVLAIIVLGIRQAYKYEFDWKALLSPDERYYRKYRKNLATDASKNIETADNSAMTQIKTISDNKAYVDDEVRSHTSVRPINDDSTVMF